MPNATDKIALAVVQQRAALTDKGRALVSLVGPVLTSLLLSINRERLDDYGGDRERIKLRQLVYLPKPGDDGAYGDAFEYALHRSVRGCDRGVVDPLFEVLRECAVPDDYIDSIFFARDKQGSAVLIDPDPHVVDKHTLIVPGQGRPPVAVHQHLDSVDKALRSAKYQSQLPESISGFAKADLLVGNCRANVWLGATVKSNRSKLVTAPGLAVGIIPGVSGSNAAPRWDDRLDMWIVEVPYDNEFMELLSSAWSIVRKFLDADARVPGTDVLPDSEHRRVAKLLEDLRNLRVLEVVAHLADEGQPGLVEVTTAEVTTLALGGSGQIVDVASTQVHALPMTPVTDPADE